MAGARKTAAELYKKPDAQTLICMDKFQILQRKTATALFLFECSQGKQVPQKGARMEAQIDADHFLHIAAVLVQVIVCSEKDTN